jgi:8-oxo-dGDP phosphatase
MPRTDNPWKKLSSKVVYENRWMRIVEDQVVTPTGANSIYAYLDSKDSVMIAALNDRDELCIIRTFAYPDGTWNWETPGGGGENEAPEIAAKRELQEETGISAATWQQLGRIRVCNGFMTEKMNVFLARDLSFDTEREVADEQIDAVTFVSMDKVDTMITQGEINDGECIAAIHLAQKWIEQQKTI